MSNTYLKNAGIYFKELQDILYNHGLIKDPKQLYGLVELRYHGNKLIGWQIDGKEIVFASDDYIDCDEATLINNGRFTFKYFSYHFKCADNNTLNSYRIDYDRDGYHLNPDPNLKHYRHRIDWENLSIDIIRFNCLLAIHLAVLYIKNGIYPADQKAGIYEKTLEGIRRKLK